MVRTDRRGGPPPRPAGVITRDTALAEDLARIAAAAGCPLVRPEQSAAGDCAVLLVGSDELLGPWGARRAPAGRRVGPPVLVVARAADEAVYRAALAVGADHVVTLPEAEPWLLDRLVDAAVPPGSAPVVGVVGGRGGSGASVLAGALARVAAARGSRVVLLDTDPWGGGADLVLGAEAESGLRWPDLAGVRGRLQPGRLGAALPQVDGVGVLAWDRRRELTELPADCLVAVLEAARREADLVVVDLPRAPDPASRTAVRHCDRVLLVVPAEVRAVAASARVLTWLAAEGAAPGIVLRGPAVPGLTREAVAQALGRPVVASLGSEPGLAAALDRGEPPALRPRGPVAVTCARLLADWAAG